MKKLAIFVFIIFIAQLSFAQDVGQVYIYSGTGDFCEVSGPNAFYTWGMSPGEYFLNGGVGVYHVGVEGSRSWQVYPALGYVSNPNGGSGDGSFTISAIVTTPTTQATNVNFTGVQNTQMTVNWTSGNGDKRAVFVLLGSSGNAAPGDNTTYTADTAFQSGTQIGSTGWYCVYNGTGTTVTVTNLTASTGYRAHVCEYNGSAGSELYNKDASTGNPTHLDSTLPVTLLSFTASVDRSDAITLTWVTESEIKNLGFILERREEETDWIEIASYITYPELQGQGSVTYRTDYYFTDNTVEAGHTYDYRLADVSYAGVKEYHSLMVLSVNVTAVVPEEYVLHPAYPNPFNPTATIRYELPQASDVQITIYDLLGKEVTTLLSETQDAGFKSVQWDATEVSSGLYFYQVRAGEFVQTRKMVLLK